MTDVTTTTSATKKPKPRQTDFADARRACRNTTEREQLALAVRGRWREAELREYARLYFFPNNKDYPTAMSYRRAIASIASLHTDALEWRKRFRRGGSKPMPPRRAGLLRRGSGNGPEVTSDEYAWPEHTDEFRSMIEQRARAYFKMGPDSPLPPNAWTASYRAYRRELEAKAEQLRREREAVAFHLVPRSRKNSPKAPRRKPVPQFDNTFWGQRLKPHFNYDFPRHTEAFREEITALARKGKKPGTLVSPLT